MGRQGLQDRYNEWHGERLASDRSVTVDDRERRFFDWILEPADVKDGALLLDVACGQGKFLEYAHARGLDVTGLDVSDVAVKAAQRRVPEAKVVLAAGESLPFEDDSFDIVTCVGSLEHFPDPAGGAAEMARVLRPGGTAIIFVPNLFFLGHIWFGITRGTQPSEGGQAFSEIFLSSGGWQELLSGAGFEVRRFRTWNYIFASERVPPIVKKAWNAVSRFVPRNGAYAFAFICGKAPSSERFAAR